MIHCLFTSDPTDLEAGADLSGQSPLGAAEDDVQEFLRGGDRRNVLPRRLHGGRGRVRRCEEEMQRVDKSPPPHNFCRQDFLPGVVVGGGSFSGRSRGLRLRKMVRRATAPCVPASQPDPYLPYPSICITAGAQCLDFWLSSRAQMSPSV